MSTVLALTVTFLDPRYHGCFADGQPEWPPSPLRLFQALLAGAAAAKPLEVRDEEALRWLERQRPPLILAPPLAGSSHWLNFVPANESDQALKRSGRLVGKTAHYALFPTDKPLQVHYFWSTDESCPENSVQQLAGQLVALGWGVDQATARAWRCAQVPQPKAGELLWRPFPGPGGGWPSYRVPVPGTLEDLVATFRSWRGRLPTPREYRHPRQLRTFAAIPYLPQTALPRRPFAVFRLPEGVVFRPENAARLAAMVRGAAIGRARADGLSNAETFVAGHVGREPITPPRFSYLPLPSVGHPFADGLIRRVLVAEPFGGDGEMADWVEEALHNLPLQDEGGRTLGRLQALQGGDGVLNRYRGPGQVWHSVTPVILPGFDDRKRTKALRLVQEALHQAAIPPEAVADVVLQKAPFFPGAHHPKHYFRPAYLMGLPAWHVRLHFFEDVAGPLALGAGRHLGLGLMATA